MIYITQTDDRHGDIDQSDRDRAIAAAERVVAEAGTTPEAAYSEYQRQWDEFDDESPMTGLARVWVEAGDAANLALSENWANPGRASCYIAA